MLASGSARKRTDFCDLFSPMKVKVSVTQLCLTLCDPWTVACQAPLSMEFSIHWSGLPFPSPGDLPKPGIKPGIPVLQTDSL